MSGTVDGIDLALLDPADPDERRLLIEAEHSRLHQALRDDVDEMVLDGLIMSPRLHITLAGAGRTAAGARWNQGRACSTPRQLGGATRRCTDQQG